MTVQYSRVQRRVDLARMKKRASKMWRFSYEWSLDRGDMTEEDYTHRICKLANNMKNCSCWMCGNPRRHNMFKMNDRITHQERKQFDKYKHDLSEIHDGNEYD